MYHFSLPNVDGTQVSLEDFSEAKGFIVIFSCNHCPYVVAYEQRMIALANEFRPKGVELIAISANDAQKYPQDSFERMQERAEQKGFPFPYLYDESQEVAQAYGAQRTPDAFVIWKGPHGLELAYRGAIDDNYQHPDSVAETYVADAVKALLAGDEPAKDFAPAVGCSIKWK